MGRLGFVLALSSGFLSVILLAWNGLSGYTQDWVYGFLAAYWSVLMLARLMTLTTPYNAAQGTPVLAQKILGGFHARQEENRQKILENSFGGSFALFLLAGFIFAAWQVFCAAFPANAAAVEGLSGMLADFNSGFTMTQIRFFDWGRIFMLILAFSMMGFVIRSHAGERTITRPVLIVLCAYAVSGFITFTGLPVGGEGLAVARADLVGNGAGLASVLLGPIAEGEALSLFEILLLDSGVIGLAILSFLLFIPLGYMTLGAHGPDRDLLITACGMTIGTVMILSAFLPFTAALGGFLALCWMGLFLAWGASENAADTLPA